MPLRHLAGEDQLCRLYCCLGTHQPWLLLQGHRYSLLRQVDQVLYVCKHAHAHVPA
jgi:hypothetical protein